MRVRAVTTVVAVASLLLAGQAAAGWYVVKRGDTLSGIAAREKLSVRDLAAANGLRDPNHLVEGTRLRIPGAPVPAPPPAPTVHVVQKGETLAAIAAKYHTTVAALAAANGIVNKDKVYVGAQLRLSPPGTPAAPARPAALPTPARPAIHVVTSGDTLEKIARRYGTSIGALVKANGIKNPNRVMLGTKLAVPGGWQCPVPGARFTNDWGFPRDGGRFHEGTDLLAPRNTPVRAPVAGTVKSTFSPRGGNQFWLAGDDGVTYFGAHLDKPSATGRVAADQPIGAVGNTGNAAGGPTHLHFEIHPGGGPAVNPYPTVLAACS